MGFEPGGDSVDFFVDGVDGGNVAFREIPITRTVAAHRGWDLDCNGSSNMYVHTYLKVARWLVVALAGEA